ncbi:hypothetical protein AB0O52_10670 [Arthrobacter sp. NPDC080073]|uniref:hypothetical protein n=1 Tax=Arthrobacter sp. NPDC080073 TaxID=3155919 RepID=UPI00341C49E1
MDRIIAVIETEHVARGSIARFHVRDDLYLERGPIYSATGDLSGDIHNDGGVVQWISPFLQLSVGALTPRTSEH